jgi:hypothetical protein
MSAEIRARIAEIEAVLFARSAFQSSNILSPNAAQLNLAREQHFEALRKERESLLVQLPKTGEASGQHLVMTGHFLRGTTYVRESVEEYRAWPGDEYGDDPMWRFAQEQGWNLE